MYWQSAILWGDIVESFLRLYEEAIIQLLMIAGGIVAIVIVLGYLLLLGLRAREAEEQKANEDPAAKHK